MGFKTNQKMVGYSHVVHSAVVQWICLVGQSHCTQQDSHLGMTDDFLSRQVACIEPPSTVQASP